MGDALTGRSAALAGRLRCLNLGLIPGQPPSNGLFVFGLVDF